MDFQSLDYVDQTDLNRFFNNEVTIGRDASSTASKVTHEYVDQLLQCVHQKDPRFGSEPLKVGSAPQRLKVGDADEFDFGVCLQGIPQRFWVNHKPRYFKLVKVVTQNGYVTTWVVESTGAQDTVPENIKVVKSDVPLPAPKPGYTSLHFAPSSSTLWAGKSDMHFGDDVVPFLVKRCFKDLLIQAVRDLGLRDHIHVSRKVSGPAITIRIEDGRLDTGMVNVDLAPTARLNMSFPPAVQWPHPNAQWPSRQKAESVKAKGVNFAAKKDTDWIVSYAEAERELRTNMDEDGGCRAKAHRLMKKINSDFLCNTTKPFLSSYHLKNVLFWECEDHPRSADWDQSRLADRFNSMMDRLVGHLQQRSLPMYFDRRVDLLKSKDSARMDEILKKIAKFREHSSTRLQEMDR